MIQVAAFEMKDDDILLLMDRNTAMAVLANLRIAFSHPDNNGASKQLAGLFFSGVADEVVKRWPDLAFYIEGMRGGETEFNKWIETVIALLADHGESYTQWNIYDLRGDFLDDVSPADLVKRLLTEKNKRGE